MDMEAFLFEVSRKFDNELESTKQYFASGHDHREISYITRFIENEAPKNVEEMKKKSNAVREKGNLIMRNSNGDMRHAARLYTEAIVAAPIGSAELAFAHANRSVALKRLGYLESAYDDCLCAFEEGYPDEMRYKIIVRQAELSKELGVFSKLQQHLSELENMKLEAPLIEQIAKLRKSMSEMEEKPSEMKESEEEKQKERLYKIVKTVGQQQRSMIATQPIKKGETIFVDRAFTFSPVNQGSQICNNCAVGMIVPFPCVNCSGSVVYCSLKCKKEHARVHEYECKFIDMDSEIDILYHCLPLRMLLEGLPELIPFLSQKQNAHALWSGCFSNKEMKDLKYIKILQLQSRWSISEEARKDLGKWLKVTEYMVIYLKNSTKFFECFSETAASTMEWKIFLGAIILRHIGQMARYTCNIRFTLNIKINRLSPRAKRGQLFKLLDDQFDTVFMFFPMLSMCKHNCKPAFRIIKDGRVMRAVANRDVSVGDEINYSYIAEGAPLLSKRDRQRCLMENHYFKCQCVACERPDKNFRTFYQFWCENPKCKKSYSPTCSDELNGSLRCPHCGKEQDLNITKERALIERLAKKINTRRAIFERFEKLKANFKDNTFAHLFMCQQIVSVCLQAHHEDEPLISAELDKLLEIAYSLLNFPKHYVNKYARCLNIALAWDIIALRAKNIRVTDLGNSMEILEEVPNEDRPVFINYYEEYIKHLI